MIVDQHPLQQVEGFVRAQVLVFRVDELRPIFFRVASIITARLLAQLVIEHRVQLELVLLHVLHQLIRSQHLCDYHQLVVVVLSLEERLLLEDLSRLHSKFVPSRQTSLLNSRCPESSRSIRCPRAVPAP